MEYKLFGHTGLRVSAAALGTLTFGEELGWGSDLDECRAMLDAYEEAGGNFIDTANRYNAGTSERYVGELLRGGRRDRFVLATKYSIGTDDGDPNSSGNHRKCLTRSLEESLRRLGTDYVDLYWLHQWDFTTSPDEVMRALDDAVRSGKVHYIGISNAPAWVVAQSNTLAELRGWSSFAGIQIEYSLIERTSERELVPMARAFDLAVVVWGAVGQGILTGKYHRAKDPASPDGPSRAAVLGPRVNERNLNIASIVADVGARTGATPAQVALRWVLSQGPDMIPVLGARDSVQLRENLAALEQGLPANERARLEEASAIARGYPYDFLNQPRILQGRFSGQEARLHSHRRVTHRT